jgi:hypothetical protein
MPWVEAMLTTAPPRLPWMQCRAKAVLRKNAPLRLMSMISFHSSQVTSVAGRCSGRPALLTRTSIEPSACVAVSMARPMLSCERSSSAIGTTLRPLSSGSASSSASHAVSMSVTARS